MESELKPYEDARIDASLIYPFIAAFSNLKFSIIRDLDTIESSYASIEESTRGQKIAISTAARMLEFNRNHVHPGIDDFDIYSCKRFNESFEDDCMISKKTMARCLNDVISACETLKNKAEALLHSSMLEKTDYATALDNAESQYKAWLKELKEREKSEQE